jgi:Mn-containing catalase
MDGKSEFAVAQIEADGQEPNLGPARPDSGAQIEQVGAKPPVR